MKEVLGKNSNFIAIISISGLANTGKSFVLNQILGVQNAFKTQRESIRKNSHVALWIFSEPIQIEIDSKTFDIYVVDSEGLDTINTKIHNFDHKLFTLNVLLSSFMIYNQIGKIDGTSISNLQMLTSIAK